MESEDLHFIPIIGDMFLTDQFCHAFCLQKETEATKVDAVKDLPDGEHWIRQSFCPYLPVVDQRLTADWTRRFRGRRDSEFYQASLEYGQSLWMEGKPAQAILQLNKAWSAELVGNEQVLKRWTLPYRALIWILINAPEGGFLGNPVRHFQHLATRVSGPNVELRSWRAWACYHLTFIALDCAEFPIDSVQVEREGLVIPELGVVLDKIHQLGISGERLLIEEAIGELEPR